MFLPLVLVTVSGFAGAQDTTTDARVHYFCFFVTGPSSEARPAEEMQAMQEKHIANLTRLYEEGKSPLAGPLGEAGKKRGIVLVDLDRDADLDAEFESDPYVQHGYLEVEAHRWQPTTGVLRKIEEEKPLQAYSLVLLRAPEGTEKEAAHEAVVAMEETLRDSVHDETGKPVLALGGRVQDDEKLCAVLVLLLEDPEEARIYLDRVPELSSGDLAAEVHRVYCGGGILEAARG